MKRLSPVSISMLAIAVLAGTALLITSGCNNGSSSNSTNAGTTVPLTKLTPISNCAVDVDYDVEIGGPDAKPGCDTVEMNPSLPGPEAYDEIKINNGGTLFIDDRTTRATGSNTNAKEPTVSTICIDNGGELDIDTGTEKAPITTNNKVILTFTDKANSVDSTNLCEVGFTKGIDVLKGGSLIMNGAKGVPAYGGVSWTTLAAPAGSHVPGAKAPVPDPGSRTLYLTADVTKGKGPKGEAEGWQPGDWIVVATTDFTPFHSEFVQISSVKSGGTNSARSTIILKQPLKYYHFGSLAPSSATATCLDPLKAGAIQPKFLCDKANRNFGVDERAEVGLISRNITLTSVTAPVTQIPPAPMSGVHWGGEIKIHRGFEKVVIQGVRLSKFGKDKLGSYPIHFHRVGDIAKAPNKGTASVLVNADSVDHSYNKCVTIHATSNLTISNLVCARIVGHIFYEELNSKSADNPADDSGIVFDHNLGIGTTSNSFDIYAGPDATGKNQTRPYMINTYWWAGDYMTNDPASSAYINYDSFNIPDTDNWLQTVHGACAQPPTGGYYHGFQHPNANSTTAACPPDPSLYPAQQNWKTYVEPASGFWIQNPGTVLTNNAIAGCQGDGIAYWWVAPGSQGVTVNGSKVDMNLYPLGKVQGDRASACHWGYVDSSELHVYGNALLDPRLGGKLGNASLIATLDDITATHIRARGVWLRDKWFVIKNSHFADDNRAVTLVTSGGIEGNAPGVWELLEDSVMIGESQDNIGRWGPCATQQSVNAGGVTNPGWNYGCIDYSYPRTGTAHSGDMYDFGYPTPERNAFGYMIYDGPVRIFHNRFVNYNYNEGWATYWATNAQPMPCSGSGAGVFYLELDDADCAALQHFETTRTNPHFQGPPAPYEGDAALGWFDSNQNAYPVTTASKQLMWLNTNFRHEIYTDKVGVDTFNDGDKNTAIVDDDGTLDGFGVQKAPNTGTSTVHPISLNNLPFNATSNSVDECRSGGTQNHLYEERDSSLMTPVEMAQLEFADLYPFIKNKQTNPSDYPGDSNTHWQYMTFTRTDKVPDGNGGTFSPSMLMKHGRNGQGQYEPKVANGYGYYVTVAKNPDTSNALNSQKAGFWKWMEIGIVDAEDPNISKTHPFYTLLGIDYKSTTQDGTTIQAPPPSTSYFTIERGYKTYGNGTIAVNKPLENGDTNSLFNYWTDWSSHPPLTSGQPVNCYTMDDLNHNNVPWSGNNYKASCPAHDSSHPLITLKWVSSISQLLTKNSDGTYTPRIDKYYYDPNTGYLWLYIVQQTPNPVAPSPIGSCDSAADGGNPDPTCPDTAHGETYYACPKAGCIIYTIEVKNPPGSTYTYTPGPSTGQPDPANLTPAPPPSTQNKLVLAGTNTVVDPVLATDKQGVPYYKASASTAPSCTITP